MKRFITHSITFRLSILMFLAMFFLLLAGSTLMYIFVDLRFDQFTAQALHNQFMTISDIIESDDNFAIQKETFWEPHKYTQEYLDKITDLHGNVISSSTDIDNKIPLSTWPTIRNGDTQSLVKTIKVNGSNYALLTGLSKPNIKGQSFKIYLAYDLTRDQLMLHDFIYDLILIVLGGLVISVLLSYILIKIGLKPLSHFIKRIETITPTTIQPLEVPDPYLELLPLITSINQLLHRINTGYQQLADFSSNIAHELRTPINNLMLETELLLTQPSTAPQTQTLLSSNLEEYQRLASIIEKLLFLARSDAKKLKLQQHTIDSYKEIQSIIEFHEITAAEKNIVVTLEGHATVAADKTLFRSAVTNILINAIKYSAPNSSIAIHVEEGAETVRISIADTGIGIPPEHLTRITERFYRVDNDRSSQSGGTGLGLAIVQKIMEIHKGRLELKANTPTGLIVTLVFPHGN